MNGVIGVRWAAMPAVRKPVAFRGAATASDPQKTARTVVAWLEAQSPNTLGGSLARDLHAFNPDQDVFDAVMTGIYRSGTPSAVILHDSLPTMLFHAMDGLTKAVGDAEAQRRLRVVQALAQRQQ